ncbi:unnamed protein product [Prorocentrum cordatum]|uniref:RING-type E3 ubiquitin transferase n=1 Tax=Prorocentrum cordatum TaxID=2364126 RepID=A0ABN9U9I4_9DINO|nr:unnamed protein product [Polarella glacialis]
MLALVWARWGLEGGGQHEDTLRHNEVLLLMSSLIYNTVSALEKVRRAPSHRELPAEGVSLDVFQGPFEYFLLLLSGVEWPKHYKDDLCGRIQSLFPTISASTSSRSPSARGASPSEVPVKGSLKEMILNHPLTQDQDDVLVDLEQKTPEPGQELFDRHRSLYQWAMQNTEALGQDFVLSRLPSLPEEVLRLPVAGE